VISVYQATNSTTANNVYHYPLAPKKFVVVYQALAEVPENHVQRLEIVLLSQQNLEEKLHVNVNYRSTPDHVATNVLKAMSTITPLALPSAVAASMAAARLSPPLASVPETGLDQLVTSALPDTQEITVTLSSPCCALLVVYSPRW